MKKKSLLLSITAIIVIAAMAIGGTLAYFTSEDEATNTFTFGNIEIELFEHEVKKITDTFGRSYWHLDKQNETTENLYEGIYPGAELPKDPTIRNTGSNPAYVRMVVNVSNPSAWGNNELKALFNPSRDWRYDRKLSNLENGTFVYNYIKILVPGSKTMPLFSSIKIPTAFDNEQIIAIGGEDGLFNINITAYAIQADGFRNADDALKALDNQLSQTTHTYS